MEPDRGAGSPDEILARIAAANHGVFLTADALAAGLTHQALGRRLDKGVVRRLHKGVYAMTSVPTSAKQTLLAACRWGGPGSAASHRSAAALWQLDGFELDVIEIVSPRRLNSDRVKARVGAVPVADFTEIDRIPVTRIERSLIDLAAAAGAGRARGRA